MSNRELACIIITIAVGCLALGFFGGRELDERLTMKHDWKDVARLDSKIADLSVQINDMRDDIQQTRCKCAPPTAP